MAAAFALNRCLWPACGQIFADHYHLIDHIETFHIETDVAFLRHQEIVQPLALPLSYVCRFFPPRSASDTAPRRHSVEVDSIASSDSDEDRAQAPPLPPRPPPPPLPPPDTFKPFLCPVPGCGKRYKNANGIRYHTKHGHAESTTPVSSTGAPPATTTSRLGVGARKHQCETCRRVFRHQAALREHVAAEHRVSAAACSYPVAVLPLPAHFGRPAPPYPHKDKDIVASPL
ncbi:juxtaposed with another zinc finger protein 1-like [Oscarella lobularis]|uniref:juxtaposed with another zinc finger protein 1-like n=1 Tax=Oscarella lobularis TaxID=121494 RepID=UPI003313FFEC